MRYALAWTETALARLEEVLDYIAERDPRAATRVVDEIFDKAETLAEFPFSGRVFSPGGDPNLRQAFVGRYRLVYRVFEEERKVSVIAIQHTSQRPLTKEDLGNT